MKDTDRVARPDGHAEESFLQGGGELGALIRGRDWRDTPLGPPASWPRSLKTAVRIMLTSRQPIWVGWGDELTYLYNDAYRSILGARHPEALGRPLWRVWHELEETVGPLAESVIRRDEGVYVETQRLIMERNGYPEETYYTYSFSPIPRDDLRPGGLICANTDETRRVIGERQIETLRELAERMAPARSRTEACESAMKALAENRRDMPFAALCEVARGRDVRTVASSWEGGADLAAALLASLNGLQDTPMSVVPVPVGLGVPSGDWPEPPTRAVAAWLQGTRKTELPLLFVAGLSPYRQFDDAYRSFLEVVAGQIDSGVGNAEAYEQERLRSESLKNSIQEHERTQAALREEAQRLEALNALGIALVSELDLHQLVQTVTDVATELSDAAFGAFFYNVADEDGGAYVLYTLSGAPREAFEGFGVPRKTALFGPTFDGEGPVRIDDVLLDPRYGTNEPHRGMPEGHLPVRSYLAVPVVGRDGNVIGGLFFGHPEPGVFTEKAERVVLGLASQAAVAIENTRLHDQREQLIEQLREADRRKDDFLAMLGHELRNPLAAIRGATDLIGILAPNDPRLTPAHGILDRQTVHVSRLIDGLLEVSRISLGKISLKTQTVDLRGVVGSVLTDHRDGADGKGIRLSHDLSGDPLWISGDPVRLTQIFDNLVSNAVKFSEPGGSVSVAFEVDGERVLARVLDDGVGIRSEHLAYIFEPFHQEVQELARTTGGLGLGLALVRSLVEMHGGSVEAHSKGLGTGAEFHVAFPRTDPKGEGNEATSATEIPPLRILLIEDSRDLVETLRLLLEADGHEARTARSGSEALEILGSYDPDVILCDLGLPGMSGYEVARSVRGTGSSIPLVALTGYGQPEDRARTSDAGFDHHLVKPVDIARLRTVFEILELPRG